VETDEFYRLAGRVGGLTTWDRDPEAAAAQLAAARAHFEAGFRSPQARRLFFAKLALMSARVRSARRRSAMGLPLDEEDAPDATGTRPHDG